MLHKYKFQGLTMNKEEVCGNCVANSISEVVTLCEKFAITLTSIIHTGTTMKAETPHIVDLKSGREPEKTVWCYECSFAEKRYRETAGDDIQYYYCKYWDSSAIDVSDYCSKGVRPKKTDK